MPKTSSTTTSKCRLCDQTLKYSGRGRPREYCLIHRRLVTSEASRTHKRTWRERQRAKAAA